MIEECLRDIFQWLWTKIILEGCPLAIFSDYRELIIKTWLWINKIILEQCLLTIFFQLSRINWNVGKHLRVGIRILSIKT